MIGSRAPEAVRAARLHTSRLRSVFSFFCVVNQKKATTACKLVFALPESLGGSHIASPAVFVLRHPPLSRRAARLVAPLVSSRRSSLLVVTTLVVAASSSPLAPLSSLLPLSDADRVVMPIVLMSIVSTCCCRLSSLRRHSSPTSTVAADPLRRLPSSPPLFSLPYHPLFAVYVMWLLS